MKQIVLLPIAVMLALHLIGFAKHVGADDTETKPEEVDGYKGVPWGLTFQEFKELKKYPGGPGEPTSRFLDSDHDLYNTYIALLLGVPINTTSILGVSMTEIQTELLPSKFYSVYLNQDGVYYIFYDGKLFMVFSELKADNYEQYHNILSKRYKVLTTISKTVPSENNEKFTAIVFKKGNTRVYLNKERIVVPEIDFKAVYVSILYIADDYYNLIKKEILKNKSGKEKIEKEEEKKQSKEDVEKIE